MENSPLVSVIIPVYNGATYLSDAINCVLAQSYQPLEIIIVDDGSTDNTAEIAAQYKGKIQYIYQDNSGPAAARNQGIKLAKGDIIGFLDVDDLWSETCLNLLVSYLVNHPNVEIAQGLIQELILLESKFEEATLAYQYVNLGSALYRKSVFNKIGYFDETMRYGEDVDFFLRAWENNIKKAVIKEVTLLYRKHQQNMTLGKHLVELGFIRVYKKHIDRCRNAKNAIVQSSFESPNLSQYLGVHPSHPRFKMLTSQS